LATTRCLVLFGYVRDAAGLISQLCLVSLLMPCSAMLVVGRTWSWNWRQLRLPKLWKLTSC